MIVENTNEVLYMGEYESLIQARADVDMIEHLDHGHGCIIVEESCLSVIENQLVDVRFQ